MPDPAQPRDDRLDRFRNYLRLLADLHFDSRLSGKVDLSDLVQETLLKAHRGLGRFRGRTDAALAAWLRRILARTLATNVRKFSTGRRDVSRERSLKAALDESSARLERWQVADRDLAGRQVARQERQLRLAEALAQLPEDQRRAVELHHLKGVPVGELGEQLGRSPGAVGALLFRGLKKLRLLLDDLEID